MYHPRLYGEFYEMGLKYGTLLKEKANFVLPEISSKKKEFGLDSYKELQNFYPEVIDEIKGFAKGINDKPKNLGAFLLSLGIFETSGQCSVFAFKNNDSVIVGRNYDMLFEFKKFTESSLIAPKDKFSYISQSDVFIGRSDGINEKGLSIAMSFVNGTKVQPGIGFHFIIRKVLENCSTTEQAINLIQQTTVASANNFLIADKNFDIAVVESAPQKSFIRRPKKNENFISITNQFISKEMKPYDKGDVEWSKSSERYNRIKENLSSVGSLDLNKAKEILSNECVCLNLKKEKFGTIWSVVANLNELKIERAETKPRLTNYKQETRLDWWLKKKNK
ncbi:putative choloylglycine hydrolase [Aquimarina sp. EL_43]|uniref:C45 family autoproteolytic acyltransferase/hydolase n=1 Tax=unclassified Aquimarina TaxID=2627091 RepID=UPI0018C9FB89|nr:MULTISPECIES: C45 family peptidase [unclassified Aquimarina]MBG6129159.1 putative choloylglycine hydrolase [Aquimarina sp. EL_35]MBG6150224.1 putative choloylglycine hydrolase [Aquimarina sp. EL_32]MBG6167091.1 putative choloylglycine hydrolase [Aquimarina sp. EL_43]